MFVQHDESGPQGGPSGPPRRDDPAGLTPVQREILWCLRRLAMVRPLGSARDAHVHALLQRRFGEQGLGLEHLLRCLIVGLARRALRPVRLHLPCHGAVAEDEQRLLLAIGESRRPVRVAAVLAPLAGSRGGELVPLLAGIAALLPAD
ncbi:hypothetical protein [Sandarakinorhabdus limnophila]|uniref:hypothetical protein n=1 Tax=Sandarakinorhabdus limnophila TaxID=210512 RepID=UPI0026F33D4C|nr:hypothetical protein [Sandarakinorhabdus limnophila]MCM0031387.1 hypothetical protein [Sandarakinorhabdus limnophila]